jgi:hypothetical protein
MALSSNTLIHFTKKLSNLEGILTNNFKIRYCRETIIANTKNYDLLIPMVSFCDIPFSQIINHIESYGCYGIGLKKDWAIRNGLNPVLYLENNSTLSNNIFHHLYDYLTEGKIKISDLTIEEKCRFDFIRYIKNYEGDLNRIGKKAIKKYRFSDEREWRYVLKPEINHLLFANIKKTVLSRISERKEFHSSKIEAEKLFFQPEDINYIIIKKESERDRVISILEKNYTKFPHEQVKRLTSRIISTEQLYTDF